MMLYITACKLLIMVFNADDYILMLFIGLLGIGFEVFCLSAHGIPKLRQKPFKLIVVSKFPDVLMQGSVVLIEQVYAMLIDGLF